MLKPSLRTVGAGDRAACSIHPLMQVWAKSMEGGAPLSELAGSVRNPEEARAIAQVDVLWQQEEILLQHLVATHGYLLGVWQCEQASRPTTG